MGILKRDETIRKIEAIADRVGQPAGIEIVEVELKGSGRNQLLRIYIDKPGGGISDKPEGVTHADCELVSRGVSELLDAEDPIAGPYELEVSSPGLERKLGRWRDWERFSGRKVKVILKEPMPGQGTAMKHFEGIISRAEDHLVTVQLAEDRQVTFPFEQVDRANLKFDW
jgi:ribosome maturation factor RimP